VGSCTNGLQVQTIYWLSIGEEPDNLARLTLRSMLSLPACSFNLFNSGTSCKTAILKEEISDRKY